MPTSFQTAGGLSSRQAQERLAENGPNEVVAAKAHRGARLLVAQFTSPIVLILSAATVVSMALGDLTDGFVILAIIVASGLLGFWQEHNAGRAIDALLARVHVQTEVIRDGRETSVPTAQIVTGDLVVLRAGDIIPADCQVTESHSLLVDEAALTGESFLAEKNQEDRLFSGTHVASGAGQAVVTRTGAETGFAELTARLASRDVTTGFERGMTSFGLLLVRVMVVLVCVIFVVNLLLNRPIVDSVLFSLALAVGLTPQLLPLSSRSACPRAPGGWRPSRSSSNASTPSRTSAR